MIPTKEEMIKALEEKQGKELQKRFSKAVVAVCGLGGLGSNISVSLARAGIGKLILIDFDRVDITNLHRQQYKASQVGRYKTDALSENLKEIAPYQRWAMAVVSYTFPEVKEHKEITHVNVSDIIEPKIGRQSIARPHYLKYSEGVEGYDATWYENYQSTGANLVLPFTGVFAEKNTYTFEVVLEAKDGYAFARKSTGLPDVVVTFNGVAVGYSIRFDGAGRLAVLEEYDYLGAAKEKIMGAVSYEIQEPVIGEKPSFKAENQREDGLYYIDTVDPNSTKYGITWYEGAGGARKMDENDTFKAGEYYYVAIKVKPIDGYQFDTDSNGDLLVKGFINRNLSVMGGNEEGMFIGYTFDKLEEEKRTIISEVEAVSNYSDIAYIGDKESTPQFTVTKGTPVRIEFTGWQTKDEKGEFVFCYYYMQLV